MNDTLWALAFLLAVALSGLAALIQDVRQQDRTNVGWQPVRGAHRAIGRAAVPAHAATVAHHRAVEVEHIGATEDWHPLAEYTDAGLSVDAAALVPPVALRAPRTDDALARFRGNMARHLSRFVAHHPDPAQIARVAQPTERMSGTAIQAALTDDGEVEVR